MEPVIVLEAPPIDPSSTDSDPSSILVASLRSLHAGDRALTEALASGGKAIPALKRVLFEREPSGLFQARCRAVEGLSTLKAYSVLGDFLRQHRPVVDPVERLGDDVVVSAAARALAALREPWVYELLLDLATERPLPGVIGGLGSFKRLDSLPVLIDSLQEDELRLCARATLQNLGPAARPSLVAFASSFAKTEDEASESRRRACRCALAMLIEMGVSEPEWSSLRRLTGSPDSEISSLARRLGAKLQRGSRAERDNRTSLQALPGDLAQGQLQ